MFKAGDLVSLRKGNDYDSYYKSYGIVLKTKWMRAREAQATDCQAVQIHWANYGVFWDTSVRIKKIAG